MFVASISETTHKYYWEDFCLAKLLQAVLLRYTDQIAQSEESFQKIMEMQSKIELDEWIIPYARFEYSKLMISQKRYKEAYHEIKAIQKNYKHYSNESRLAFRMHHELQQPYFAEFS